jgi:hypothetical protein
MKALAKAVLPRKLVQAIGQWRLRQREWKVSQANVGRSTSEVFSEIYANNTWGGKPGEFHSGSGSYGLAATRYLDTINEFIANHNTGVDVVPALVDRNNAEFGSAHRRFMCLDAAGADALPSGDLCLVRQVMQHLSNDQIQVILGKLKVFKYVIVTEHQPSVRDFKAPNIDKAHGKDTRLYYGSGVYLDKSPYGAKLTSS